MSDQRQHALGKGAGQRAGAVKTPEQTVMHDQSVGPIVDGLPDRIARRRNGEGDALDLRGPFYLQAVRAIVGIALRIQQDVVKIVELLLRNHGF